MALPDIDLTLLQNVASTPSSYSRLSRGGLFCLAVVGTWNGATAKLQMLGPNGAAALDVGTDASFTANGSCLVELPAGDYRMVISGGPPSAMYATLKEIRRF